MAKTVYVNTDNTGTKDGTTFANGYDNLQDAITAELAANANRTGDGPLTIYCGGAAEDTTAVDVNGFTLTASDYLLIQAHPTESTGRHAGIWNTGTYRLITTSGANTLSLQDNYVYVDGIQVQNNSAGSNYAGIYVNGDPTRISNCIVRMAGDDSNAQQGIKVLSGTGYIWNCIVYGLGATALVTNAPILVSAGTTNIYNCTLIGGYGGIRVASGATATAKNCYCKGTSAISSAGTLTQTYCATSDTTADGTGAQDSVAYDTTTFVSVTPGNADYLKPNSAGVLDGNGDAPGGSAPLDYTTDIAGTTVTTWDIGAFNYADATAQYARPSSTVAAGNWDGFIAGVDQNDSSNLDNYIDETTADDNDSIRSGTSPSDDSCTIGLSEIQTPAAGTVTMRIRARFL